MAGSSTEMCVWSPFLLVISNSMPRRIFSPTLPLIKTDAIANIGMGTVNKVILVFDGQVLPDEVFRLEMIWDRDNYNSEDVAQNWVRKIPFFEAVAQNALMGLFILSILYFFFKF